MDQRAAELVDDTRASGMSPSLSALLWVWKWKVCTILTTTPLGEEAWAVVTISTVSSPAILEWWHPCSDWLIDLQSIPMAFCADAHSWTKIILVLDRRTRLAWPRLSGHSSWNMALDCEEWWSFYLHAHYLVVPVLFIRPALWICWHLKVKQ